MALPQNDKELEAFMESHGWEVWDTGGGCQNWGKEFPDGETALMGGEDGTSILTVENLKDKAGLSMLDKEGSHKFDEWWPTFEKLLTDMDQGAKSGKGVAISSIPTEADRSAKRVELMKELMSKGVKITPDGTVAKADIARVLAEEELHMSSDEYNTILEHIGQIYDAIGGLNDYVLSLLSKGSPEKDKVLNEMLDAIAAQRKSVDGFYKHFNK